MTSTTATATTIIGNGSGGSNTNTNTNSNTNMNNNMAMATAADDLEEDRGLQQDETTPLFSMETGPAASSPSSFNSKKNQATKNSSGSGSSGGITDTLSSLFSFSSSWNNKNKSTTNDVEKGIAQDDDSSPSKMLRALGTKVSGGSELTPKLIFSCLFQLPMGMIWSTIGLIVLPHEAERFFPRSHGSFLGILLTIAGASQIISPIVGKMSDRYRSKYGRRRPFIFFGSICTSIGVIGLFFCSIYVWIWWYAIFLFTSQVGLNIIYSATVMGLTPDALSDQKNKHASASGVIAIFHFMGMILGMGFVMTTSHMEVWICYPVYLISILLTCLLAWVFCPEESTLDRPMDEQDQEQDPAFYEYYKTLLLDITEEPDFFWVFVGRTLYYLSVSCQSFLFYYTRDVIGLKEDSSRRFYVGLLVILAQVAGAIVAYPAGQLSNKVGRKKLIYAACGIMAAVYGWYLWIPFIMKEPVGLLLCGAATYGIAIGCYMSVDYALALDCLPANKGPSEALGLWGISGFIGTYVGPMVGGSLLTAFGSTNVKEHYSYAGYCSLLGFGGLVAILSGVVTAYIKRTN